MKKQIFIATAILSAFAFNTAAYGMEEMALQRIWKKNCRKCHDKDGTGGTPAGKKLGVLDYTIAENQAKFTDEEAIKIIKEGSKDENGKNLMEAYPELTDEEVLALVGLVRSFAAKE